MIDSGNRMWEVRPRKHKINCDFSVCHQREAFLPEHCELVDSWEYVLAGHTILMSTCNTSNYHHHRIAKHYVVPSVLICSKWMIICVGGYEQRVCFDVCSVAWKFIVLIYRCLLYSILRSKRYFYSTGGWNAKHIFLPRFSYINDLHLCYQS